MPPHNRASWLRADPPGYELVPVDGWRLHAACHNHPDLPPETWDDSLHRAADGRSENAKQRAARLTTAIAACKTCPVQAPCLRDVDLRYDEGVRGGIDLRTLREKKRNAS